MTPDALQDAVRYHYGAFPPGNLDYGRLMDPLFRATQGLAAYDQMLGQLQSSAFLIAPMRNQEAVVSSRMEGTVSTLDEILAIDAGLEADADGGFQSARSEAVETYLYARAMQQLQRNLTDGQSLSEFQIRQAHQLLLSFGRGALKRPGQYKESQNYVGESFRRKVSFIPISPEALPAGMAALMTFVENPAQTPLLRVALSHVEFEALHPFEDGNGRLGRILITLMLWNLGVIREPNFYVSARLEELREEYLDRMRRVSSHGEWTEWCVFFLNVLADQATLNIATVRQVMALYDEMKARFRDLLNSPWSQEAVDYVFRNPTFYNNRFTGQSKIPTSIAMAMSRKLRDADLIRAVKPGAGQRPALYAFWPLIDLIRA